MVKQENYVTSQPITFYTEKLNDGTFFASKQNNSDAAFNRNNDFAKSFSSYKNKIQ